MRQVVLIKIQNAVKANRSGHACQSSLTSNFLRPLHLGIRVGVMPAAGSKSGLLTTGPVHGKSNCQSKINKVIFISG